MSIEWFANGWGVGFAAYIIVQVGAVLTLRNRWRWISAIPVPFMAYILAITAQEEAKGSNLWPLMMILLSPGAALGVVLMWVTGLTRSGRRSDLWAPIVTVVGLVGLGVASSEGLSVLWSGMFTLVPAAACLGVALAIEAYFHRRNRSVRAV